MAYACNQLGNYAFARGDWDESQRYFEEAAEISRSLGSARTGGNAPERVFIPMLRGEPVVRELEEITGEARQAGDLASLAWAELYLAWLDILGGCPERAISRLEAFLQLPDVDAYLVDNARVYLAQAYIDAGRLEPAAALVARGREQSPDVEWWTWTAAKLAGARGQWEESRRAFEEALSICGQRVPVARAIYLLDYGTMLAAAGEPDEARRHLSEALAIFQRLGAGLFIPATERALAELG